MFLSNRIDKLSANEDRIKPYELVQFESACAPLRKDRGTFQALYNDSGSLSAFRPLKRDGSPDTETPADIAQKFQEKVAILEQEAYATGFAQGEKDGLELGEAKSRKVIENIEALLAEIAGLRAAIVKQHEKDILDIICQIAGKIVHHQVGLNRAAVKEGILAAIHLATEKRTIQMKVNSDDYEYVDRLKPEFFQRFNELKSIVVAADSSIKRGGCFLETDCGDVDARIETQLEKIRQCLEEADAQDENE